MRPDAAHKESELLQSLLKVGLSLSATPRWREMLEVILAEARKLTHAEAGSLYVHRNGKLRFAAAQNDRLGLPAIIQHLLDKETPASGDSLVGYAASTGRALNITDAYCVPAGAPYRHNRTFDEATGYRTGSILAMPLKRPDGQCVGVLELLNCIGPDGKARAFSSIKSSGLLSLASMAAVCIHNALLQEDLKEAHLDTIIRLSVAAECRDDDTGDHIRRMSRSAALIARGLGLGEKAAELIRYASPMHDVGKIGIPDTILLKPGRLTPSERQIVETHTTIGAEILKDPQNELIRTAHDVALSHHERWDGGGYPNKLAGESIPICARIVGLADVFDALVTRRCYKEPFALRPALNIIRDQSSGHFDPAVTKAFFDVLDDVIASYDLVSAARKAAAPREKRHAV